MNIISEQELLATILKLTARHTRLTLGDIKHRTRAFRRTRHIPDESLFGALEKFVESGFIKRLEVAGRIVYGNSLMDTMHWHKKQEQKDYTKSSLVTGRPEGITSGQIEQIRLRAIAHQKSSDEQKKLREDAMANYIGATKHAESEEERIANEKARRAERKQEVEDAANAKPDDIIASLDEPETNFGV